MTAHELLSIIARDGAPWRRDALCREYSDLDFVPGTQGSVPAKLFQVCGRCLVRRECLAEALADATLLGVWGGTTASARKAMRLTARTMPAESTPPPIVEDGGNEAGEDGPEELTEKRYHSHSPRTPATGQDRHDTAAPAATA